MSKQSTYKDSQQISEVSKNLKAQHHYATKKIKADQYQITLLQVRQNLPKNQQAFSKFIHLPVVERVGEIGAKTIGRPTGIIGGASLTLIVGIVVIIIARNIGFIVPNSIFAILFMIGYAVGIVLEVVIFGIRKLLNRR